MRNKKASERAGELLIERVFAYRNIRCKRRRSSGSSISCKRRSGIIIRSSTNTNGGSNRRMSGISNRKRSRIGGIGGIDQNSGCCSCSRSATKRRNGCSLRCKWRRRGSQSGSRGVGKNESKVFVVAPNNVVKRVARARVVLDYIYQGPSMTIWVEGGFVNMGRAHQTGAHQA